MAKLTKSRAPGAAALKKAELSILLTNNRKIRKINHEWRQKDKATDVLSFPQHEEKTLRAFPRQAVLNEWLLGDIIISLERAKEQAQEKKIPYRRELEILLVHGILHLLGYDHETTEKEAARMKRMERALLTR